MPTATASYCARRRCTRSRTASPVIATGLRPGAARFAVGRYRELEHHIGPAGGHAQDMAGMRAPRFVRAGADIDRDAGGAQPRVTRAGHFRIGILKRRDDARQSGGNHRVRTGRRFAVMRARLERDVERPSPRRRAGAAQGLHFGMRPPAGLRPAASDNAAVLDDHRADGRVWPGAAEPAAPKRQSKRHETPIVRRSVRRARHSAASSPDNSASAVSKSLASRKLR